MAKKAAAMRSVSRSVSAKEFSVRTPTSSPHSASRQTNAAARDLGIKAGDLVRGASKMLGGGGGGKPDFAQGGGADASKIDEALEALKAQAMKG